MTSTALARRSSSSLRPFAVPAGVAVAATGAYLLVSRSLIDDAYITMAYARNVGLHLHWGLIADETANSATSPLNVLALGAITAVVRDTQVAVGVLFVLSAVLAARWLTSLADELGLSRLLAVVAVGLLLVNPLLLSTVGLEPYLTAALFAGLLRYGVAGRGAAFGLVGGLSVLARPDTVVVVVVAALVLRPGLVRALAAALAVTLPWYGVSWFVLGSALPDTLVMKVGDTWSRYGFWNGPALYLGVYPVATVLAFLPVLVGVVVLACLLVARVRAGWAPWQRVATVAGSGGAAHYGAYCLLHTAPYHWYYAPLVVGMTLCCALAVARWAPRGGEVPRGRAAEQCHPAAIPRRRRSGLGVLLPVVLGLVSLGFDLAHGLPWERAPISTNWATAAQYQRMGEDLGRIVGRGAVESPGEIGTLAYYCDCAIVDAFSDRGRVIGAIQARERSSGRLTSLLLRANYVRLDVTQLPRAVDYRLRYQPHQAADGPREWPDDHWVDGPGRIVLLPP